MITMEEQEFREKVRELLALGASDLLRQVADNPEPFDCGDFETLATAAQEVATLMRSAAELLERGLRQRPIGKSPDDNLTSAPLPACNRRGQKRAGVPRRKAA